MLSAYNHGMDDRNDVISVKDRRMIVIALFVIGAPVLLVLAFLLWHNADAMKPVDWIFVGVVPVTAVVALAVNRLAGATFWNRFTAGSLADIRNRRLIGEASVFVVLMSLVAFSASDSAAEGWSGFLRLVGINMLAATTVIALFLVAEAMWKRRKMRDD